MEDTNINPSVPPAYSPPENSQAHPRAHREPTIHLYELTNSKSRPWAVLKVASNAASSAQLPHVYEGEPIIGSVNLDLEKGVQIKSVSITVSGAIITTNNSVHTFVCITKELWSTAFGDPAAPPMTTGSPFKGKIQGQLSWPFSISLPAEVDISFQRSTRSFKLPGSFYARGARVTVHYRINVAIIRGKFQTDYNLGTNIGYTPIIRPDPPSIVRQLAYQENSPLVDLDGDPEGWLTLAPVTVHGSVFRVRSVEAIFSLSLARPLSYTRGTVIPLLLTIECSDLQALDVLSCRTGPLVRLKRHISMKYDADTPNPVPENHGVDLKEVDQLPAGAFRDLVDEMQVAAWWHPAHIKSSPTGPRRCLQGEIRLEKSLPPSSLFGHFRITVSTRSQGATTQLPP